jgi:thiamine-phosphate pyrophosphorylase
VLRLIDANLDRLGEGLRLLEDVARFLLDDAALSRQLKTLRHKLQRDVHPLEPQLLTARNARQDVGASTSIPEGAKHKDLAALVTANARRVQESLRVLEECARLPDTCLPMGSEELGRLRFEVYEIEKGLVSRLLRKDKAARLRGLYVIIDAASLAGRDPVEATIQAIHGGAKTIQLRDNEHSKRELLGTALKLRKVCEEGRALFIINDHADLAAAAGADGLHLGQSDLPLSEARRLMPIDRLIGCSTNTLSQAKQAQSEGADYVAVGSVYPTGSKAGARLVGLDALRKIKGKLSLPVIAIGGINQDNVEEVMKAGADGVAVISAVLGADSIEAAARCLVGRMDQFSVKESEDGKKHR